MKKLLLLIPVILVLLVSGCTTQDPEEIVKESAEKLEALDSYKASYDLSMSTYGVIIGGSVDIYRKGNKTRADMVMSVMGQTQSVSTYELPDGTYSCTEAAGSITCLKGQGQTALNPEDTAIVNTEMIEKGVIVLTFNNIANIAGRNCYNISSDFDFSKLSELDPEELEALGGMALIEGLFGALGASTTFGMSQCYGFDTGMPLEVIILIEMDMSGLPPQDVPVPDKISISIKMTAKSFEPDAVIADSVFDLPAEPIEPFVPEIDVCTDRDTGMSMSKEEAKAIALASDCVINGSIIEGTEFCNNIDGSWWIDLDIEKPNCNPACVIDVADKTAEINWRCTGVIEATTCTDSEGAVDNYFSKGSITAENAGGTASVTDSCLSELREQEGSSQIISQTLIDAGIITSSQLDNQNILIESYCPSIVPNDLRDLRPFQKAYVCPAGCQNGACVPE